MTQGGPAPTSFIAPQEGPAPSNYISSTLGPPIAAAVTAQSQAVAGVTNNDSLLQIISKLQVIVQDMAANIDRSTNDDEGAARNSGSVVVPTIGSSTRSSHPSTAANPTMPPATRYDSGATSSSSSVDSSTNIPTTRMKQPQPLSQHHLRPSLDIVHPIGSNPPSSPSSRPYPPSGPMEATTMPTDGEHVHTGPSVAAPQPSGTTINNNINSYSGEDRTYQLLQLLASLAPASSSSLSSSSSSALLPIAVPENQIQLDQHMQEQLSQRRRQHHHDNDDDNLASNQNESRRQQRRPHRQQQLSPPSAVVEAEENTINEYNSVTDREDETASPHHHHHRPPYTSDGTSSRLWNHNISRSRQKSP